MIRFWTGCPDSDGLAWLSGIHALHDARVVAGDRDGDGLTLVADLPDGCVIVHARFEGDGPVAGRPRRIAPEVMADRLLDWHAPAYLSSFGKGAQPCLDKHSQAVDMARSILGHGGCTLLWGVAPCRSDHAPCRWNLTTTCALYSEPGLAVEDARIRSRDDGSDTWEVRPVKLLTRPARDLDGLRPVLAA